MGYIEPTTEEIKNAVESGVEFDLYKNMPDGEHT
jgi:hypothetical protein